MNKIALAATVALVAMTSVASAENWNRRGNSQNEVDARQDRQEQRIQQGVRSGEISRREYQALEAEQARIRQLEAQARRDGRIDPREAAQIREAQNQASRHIYQESHDSERRGNWYRRWW